MVSLSKGLGAPVGSILCGSKDFIVRARHFRKMLGGGMRQTGWLCACGLVALSEKNISRLKTDHDNAQLLARGLRDLPGVGVGIERTHTNYVLAALDTIPPVHYRCDHTGRGYLWRKVERKRRSSLLMYRMISVPAGRSPFQMETRLYR